ncbi:MAG: hypothetical protein RLZZ522_662 [Verrucomicrobiota bacterium]
MCPDCRFVFRVPRDHDGTGLVCPGCRRLLRIPHEGDVPPPLTLGFKKAAAPQETAVPIDTDEPPSQPAGGERVRHSEQHKVRKRKSAPSSDSGPHQVSWEHGTSGIHRFGRLDSIRMRWLLGGGGVMLGVIGVGITLALRGEPDEEIVTGGEPISEAHPPPAPAGKRSEAAMLVVAETLAKKFFNARTIAELLPVVRNPDQAQARMRQAYPDGVVVPPGMVEFNPDKTVSRDGAVLRVAVRTGAFELRGLDLVETPAGLKIDWESWVGWSAMGWAEFLATKPTTPQTFRAVVRAVDYYNFGFTDDKKWRSFRLESPTGEHWLYGYVQRDSAGDRKVRIHPDLKQSALMLTLRFPEGTTTNQVLIDEVVSESWVEKEP